MRMATAICVLGAALALAATLAASTVDITGKWTASFETAIGRMDYTYDFSVKDGTLTGKATSSFGVVDLLDGKVDGDKVTFGEMLDGSIRIDYTGKIVSADEIQFTRQVGELATEELVAKRVKK
jgi:hypothetical protein